MSGYISRRSLLKQSILLLCVVATANTQSIGRVFAGSRGSQMSGNALIENKKRNGSITGPALRISVKANGKITVFELNDSQAARDFYTQLPLTLPVEDYAGNEKIFYPPEKLGTTDTPLVRNVQPGTLAYYAPWGDVVMFYERFGSAPGLYELGHAVSGGDYIQGMSGTIEIEKVSTP